MNNAFSSYFMVIYDQLLHFKKKMVCLQNVLKTKYIFLPVGMWKCMSVVEYSTVDREVGG